IVTSKLTIEAFWKSPCNRHESRVSEQIPSRPLQEGDIYGRSRHPGCVRISVLDGFLHPRRLRVSSHQLSAANHRVPRRVHQVIIALDDASALVVAVIPPELTRSQFVGWLITLSWPLTSILPDFADAGIDAVPMSVRLSTAGNVRICRGA